MTHDLISLAEHQRGCQVQHKLSSTTSRCQNDGSFSLLPFQDCAMVDAMNPLEIRGLLAAGPFGAPVEFSPIAAQAHGFIENL